MEYQNVYFTPGKKFSIKNGVLEVASPKLELDLFACRVCLATDIKLFDIHECDLAENYETVLGFPVPPDDGLPQHLCHYCFSQLQKYAVFREKCKHSLDILETAVLLSQPLTTDYIRIIDREAEGLALPLAVQDTIIDYEIINDPEPPVTGELDVDMENVKQEIVYEETTADQEIYEVVEQDDYIEQEETAQAVEAIQESSHVVRGRTVSPRKTVKPRGEKARCFRVTDHPLIELVTLSKEQQMEEMVKRQNSAGYLSALHKCDKCFRGFHNSQAFLNHMVYHNVTSGAMECEVCEMRFVTEPKLRLHVANVHERRFLCRQCGYVCSSSHRAIEHQKQHAGKKNECQFCGEKFENITLLMAHQHDNHMGELRVVASRTGSYKRGSNIETWISCEECNTEFNGATAFSRHMSTSSRHTSDSGSYFHYCNHCGESFEKEDSLEEHKLMHVNYEESKPKFWRREIIAEEDKPFTCQYCGKGFKVQQYLQIHVRTHTGERPYVCNICSMAFQAKANLNRHFKVHTGDKPYVCDLCGHSFTQSNSMKLHVKTVHLRMPDPYRDRRKFYRNRRKDGPDEAEEQDD